MLERPVYDRRKPGLKKASFVFSVKRVPFVRNFEKYLDWLLGKGGELR
jgi:hypothetical protein